MVMRNLWNRLKGDTGSADGGSSISLGTILFVVFLVLKLTHVIHWSWVWVTAPLWISAAVFVFFLVLFFVAFSAASKKSKSSFSRRF